MANYNCGHWWRCWCEIVPFPLVFDLINLAKHLGVQLKVHLTKLGQARNPPTHTHTTCFSLFNGEKLWATLSGTWGLLLTLLRGQSQWYSENHAGSCKVSFLTIVLFHWPPYLSLDMLTSMMICKRRYFNLCIANINLVEENQRAEEVCCIPECIFPARWVIGCYINKFQSCLYTLFNSRAWIMLSLHYFPYTM